MNPRAIALAAALLFAGLAAPAATVRRVALDVEVYPASVQRIVRAIDAAEREGDALVLVVMDTPGGRVDATQKLVQRMLASEVPIAVWVGPAGAHAASAGFIIMTAADLAAMAPGTRAGASAVIAPGEDDEGVALKKANEDVAAMMRSIAERRGRDVSAAEQAVREAKAYTENEALRLRLIDAVVSDPDTWIAQLDGTEVRRFGGETTTLDLSDWAYVESEESFKDRFLFWLGKSEIVYVLLLLGLAGLYFELQNPGMILPAAIGIVALALFALGTQLLPISWLGVGLILIGIFLFALEVKVASLGLLAFAGTVALLVGSLMFVDSPIEGLRLSLWFVLPTVAIMSAFCFGVVRLAVRAQRARVATGGEALIGSSGKVVDAGGGQFSVRLHGELWNAEPRRGTLAAGDVVTVVGRDGLKLIVEGKE